MQIEMSRITSCKYFQQMMDNLRLLSAVKTNNFDKIKKLVQQGSNIKKALITTGSVAGYTALHIACQKNIQDLVKLLIQNYKLDLNAKAHDGVYPIHIAAFNGHLNIVKILVNSGANVDVEFNHELHRKYAPDTNWSDDHRGTMNLLTFAIFNRKSELAELLIPKTTQIGLTCIDNKTLLMHALRRELYSVAASIAAKMKNDIVAVNVRDRDGLNALHYFAQNVHWNRWEESETKEYKRSILQSLIEAGADIYATVNGDPDTMLLNQLTSRHCSDFLKFLLPHYASLKDSKALKNLLFDFYNNHWFNYLSEYTSVVINDLLLRRTFNLPVHEEELKLLDELVKKHKEVRSIVRAYKQNFLRGTLVEKVMKFKGKRVTLFEFASRVFHNKRILLLLEDDQDLIAFFMKFVAVNKLDEGKDDLKHLITMLKLRIEMAYKRRKLLTESQKLTKCLPLPNKIVLNVIEYLNNDHLDKFVSAFYNS